jgi:YHS domain-containing protein
MPNRFKPWSRRSLMSAAGLLCLSSAIVARADLASPLQALSSRVPETTDAAMPQYDQNGALKLPESYRQWVFVGSSLGLSYSEGQSGMEMFHETLMEPTAYKHFVESGTFREGTMLALILHGTGESVMPARRGRFASDVHGVEMAVKDSLHRPEGWAYYNFGGMNGIRAIVQAMPKDSCYNCHVQHAKRDNVFLQFYPLLAEAAHLSASVPAQPVGSTVPTTAPDRARSSQATRLAIRGLDPVLLIAGREELGKPEIVASHEGLLYQFVSEPNRATFAADPARFSIQNTMCPVVPSAQVDPSIFAVHEGRIWAFATADCVARFKTSPEQFIKPRAR